MSGKFEVLIGYGTRAAQPSATQAGSLYFVTDEGVLERANGSTWDTLGFDADGLSFTPIDLNDWDCLVDPGGVADALDELAGRVTDLEGVGAAAGDYELIEHLDKDVAAGANFDFTGIASTYAHLMIIVGARTTDASSRKLNMTFNGDSAANYQWRYENRLGTANGAGVNFMSLIDLPDSGDTADRLSIVKILIPQYTSANWDKEYFSEGYDPINDVHVRSYGVWNNTNAITRVTLTPAAGNLSQYSYADLYGIN